MGGGGRDGDLSRRRLGGRGWQGWGLSPLVLLPMLSPGPQDTPAQNVGPAAGASRSAGHPFFVRVWPLCPAPSALLWPPGPLPLLSVPSCPPACLVVAAALCLLIPRPPPALWVSIHVTSVPCSSAVAHLELFPREESRNQSLHGAITFQNLRRVLTLLQHEAPQEPGAQVDGRAPEPRSPGARSPGGWRSPGAPEPGGWRSPGARSPGARSPGAQVDGGAQEPRSQEPSCPGAQEPGAQVPRNQAAGGAQEPGRWRSCSGGASWPVACVPECPETTQTLGKTNQLLPVALGAEPGDFLTWSLGRVRAVPFPGETSWVLEPKAWHPLTWGHEAS